MRNKFLYHFSKLERTACQFKLDSLSASFFTSTVEDGIEKVFSEKANLVKAGKKTTFVEIKILDC